MATTSPTPDGTGGGELGPRTYNLEMAACGTPRWAIVSLISMGFAIECSLSWVSYPVVTFHPKHATSTALLKWHAPDSLNNSLYARPQNAYPASEEARTV